MPDDSPDGSIYGYTPTRWITIIFIVLFSITTIVHAGQAIKYRTWWLLPTAVICGIAEIMGWSARLWSSWDASRLDPFLMQICTTIMGPSWLTAANFIVLGRIIRRLGKQYSRLSPRSYSYIFVTADLVALIVQSIGGATASQAAETGIGDPDKGSRIMLGGIIVQMVAIAIYTALAIEFFFRFQTKRAVSRQLTIGRFETLGKVHDENAAAKEVEVDPNSEVFRKARLMLIGLCISTTFILIRTIYRTIELNDGWGGRIITNETYFNVLDGAAIVLAMVTLNIFHPGRLLPQTRPRLADAESDTTLHSNTAPTTTEPKAK